jgi:hypothetical protein
MVFDSLSNSPGVKDAKFIYSLVPSNFRRITQSVLAGNDSFTVNFDLLRPHCIIHETREFKDLPGKQATPRGAAGEAIPNFYRVL